MASIAEKLKEIIERESPEYLSRSPYEVYEEILKTDTADRKMAAALLYTMILNIPDRARKAKDKEELSKTIGAECGFKKAFSDKLAEVYHTVYSEQNQKEWTENKLAGLRKFLSQSWEMTWEGRAVWDEGSGTVSCSYSATFELETDEKKLKDSSLDWKLARNPFMSEKEIAKYVEEEISDYLDKEFGEYCSCDDYYPPVAEDFEAEYYLEAWCKENGYEIINFDGDGMTGDYESNFRRY